jgi:hypothetical protein
MLLIYHSFLILSRVMYRIGNSSRTGPKMVAGDPQRARPCEMYRTKCVPNAPQLTAAE